MASERVRRALAQCDELLALPVEAIPGARAQGRQTPLRTFAIGDPQAPAERFFTILERYDLLDRHGLLAGDAVLVTIGDHFDFGRTPEPARTEGLRVGAWLAAQGRERVRMILGNHDYARVGELAVYSDEAFAAATELAERLDDFEERGLAGTPEHKRLEEELRTRYPELDRKTMRRRSLCGFSERQRELVETLLVNGTFRLAEALRLPGGRAAIATHAGLTNRELAMLDRPHEGDPVRLAAALNVLLAARVRAASADWVRGVRAPLDLAPLHLRGAEGVPGGGLLSHRVARPGESVPARAPRRFPPSELPDALVQICGHVGHRRCVADLGDWVTDRARESPQGPIRAFVHSDGRAAYDLGVPTARADDGVLVLIDGSMDEVPPERYEVLEVAGILEADC